MTIPSGQNVVAAARRTKVAAILRRKVTVGWVLLVTAMIFICFVLITYSVKVNFNADQDRVDQTIHDTCVASNEVRSRAATVAEADVASDRQIWQAINDLIPDGLPEPAHTIIFSGLDERLARIDATYKQVVCPKAPNQTSETSTTD